MSVKPSISLDSSYFPDIEPETGSPDRPKAPSPESNLDPNTSIDLRELRTISSPALSIQGKGKRKRKISTEELATLLSPADLESEHQNVLRQLADAELLWTPSPAREEVYADITETIVEESEADQNSGNHTIDVKSENVTELDVEPYQKGNLQDQGKYLDEQLEADLEAEFDTVMQTAPETELGRDLRQELEAELFGKSTSEEDNTQESEDAPHNNTSAGWGDYANAEEYWNQFKHVPTPNDEASPQDFEDDTVDCDDPSPNDGYWQQFEHDETADLPPLHVAGETKSLSRRKEISWGDHATQDDYWQQLEHNGTVDIAPLQLSEERLQEPESKTTSWGDHETPEEAIRRNRRQRRRRLPRNLIQSKFHDSQRRRFQVSRQRSPLARNLTQTQT